MIVPGAIETGPLKTTMSPGWNDQRLQFTVNSVVVLAGRQDGETGGTFTETIAGTTMQPQDQIVFGRNAQQSLIVHRLHVTAATGSYRDGTARSVSEKVTPATVLIEPATVANNARAPAGLFE